MAALLCTWCTASTFQWPPPSTLVSSPGWRNTTSSPSPPWRPLSCMVSTRGCAVCTRGCAVCTRGSVVCTHGCTVNTRGSVCMGGMGQPTGRRDHMRHSDTAPREAWGKPQVGQVGNTRAAHVGTTDAQLQGHIPTCG